MIILGISAYYHDSAICLLNDDSIVFAIQEERLSRKKADARFPSQSISSMCKFLADNNSMGGGIQTP